MPYISQVNSIAPGEPRPAPAVQRIVEPPKVSPAAKAYTQEQAKPSTHETLGNKINVFA